LNDVVRVLSVEHRLSYIPELSVTILSFREGIRYIVNCSAEVVGESSVKPYPLFKPQRRKVEGFSRL
jgi:hypothetical protein